LSRGTLALIKFMFHTKKKYQQIAVRIHSLMTTFHCKCISINGHEEVTSSYHDYKHTVPHG
jgi:hypothetical protein